MAKTLKINGQERQFAGAAPATLADLLKQLGVEATTVVAELDGQIVRPGDFAGTQIHDGQSIELVRFMGGG